MKSLPNARLQSLIFLIVFSILTVDQTALAQIAPRPPVTILGQPQQTPYVVIIPTSDRRVLQQLQRYIPTAFITNSRLGPYIQAGAYADRKTADYLSHQLRRRGLDARVVFLPIQVK